MSTKNILKAETLTTTWTFPATHNALTAPLVVAGDRLIGTAGSVIFVIDMHTGKPVGTSSTVPKQSWPYKLKSFYGSNPQVTAAGGVVYLMDGDDLLALRLSDGAPLPGWKPPSLKQGCNLFARGGRLFAVHLDKRTGWTQVSGYDAVTGTKAFGPTKITDQRAGRVAFGGGAVFFVASGKLNAVNIDYGDTRWQISVPGDTLEPNAAPLVTESVVIVPGTRSVHGIDIITGAVKWSVAASGSTSTQWFTPAANQLLPAVAATKAANQRAVLPTDEAPNPAAAVAAKQAAGIAVAVNSTGDIMGISILTGKVEWRASATKPGAPVVIENTVYVTTDGGARLARFDLYKGSERGISYVLPNVSSAKFPPVIGNGAIHIPDQYGAIAACPFASQSAAWFDGSQSRIDIKADEGQFDFGAEDFTVEAWMRSSVGGEIISSYPTEDLNGHGFRLNMTPDGQIRVAITNSNGSVASRGRTRPTNAADGEWHHVALIRREREFVVMLDGLSLPVLLPPGEMANVAVGGKCALTIGAFVSAKNGKATEHFRGLIREVRIWDRALDVPTVADNQAVALTGTEPRLRGLWRLDEVQREGAPPVQPRNAAARHRSVANFVTPASKPTDLIMDQSAFPYLLHEAEEQWPYAGTWAARGSKEATGPATVSSDSVVAFGTNNAIYAVGGHDGKRVWSMSVSHTASNPVADGNGFLVLTEEESLCRLDSRTGAKTQLKGFEKMPLERNVPVVDPVASGRYVAATTPNGAVTIVNRQDEKAKNLKIAGPVVRLDLADIGLLALTGAPAARQLALIDPAAGTARGTIASGSDAFCIADNWVLCVKDGAIVRLDSANFSLNAILATSAKIPGKITGMIACSDEDLLVVATDGGIVYGMTLGRLSTTWQVKLPAGKGGGSNAVNPPALDEDRRIVCTTAGGTLAVLDPETGAFLGLYAAMRGAIGRPAFAAGTLYTGCEDAPESDKTAELDGALHSVVFGETVALRLNLDEHGKPVAGGTQHAVIDTDTEDCTLHLMGVHESCVEAWVNIPVLMGTEAERAGGGIVSICPARNSGFDINMWIEPNGRLHYSSRAQDDDGSWHGVHVHACTTIIDGDWHHIAVSRMLPLRNAPAGSPDRVVLYIDGVAVDTTPGPEPHAPLASTIGLKAFVGAIASDTLTATQPFVGMIAEVRVWDTYMVPTEIASRMHVKLRGDEAGLLAYWNFDYEAVHDSTRQGHDGKLVQAPTTPVWWLTDLPFTQPAYPHVTTAASITSQAGAAQTAYSVTVKVCRADGSGIADQEVLLWYLNYHKDDPASILLNTKTLNGVKSSADMSPADTSSIYVGKTGSDGIVKLSIITSSPGHGPALDLWTNFMPTNERLHVNVLIDNQKLSKPAPPTLTAQAKLIQDYNYTTGNKINHERDRSTWRVVLRASDSNNAPCPNEPVTIWSSTATSIEVLGKSYSINQNNSANFFTEPGGELTVVMAADGLVAPTLYARAGFMHRNDRIVINPDQDAHESLSGMKDEELTKPRITNWKKPEDVKPGDKDSLLGEKYHDEAPKVAQAVRHVTSSVRQSEPDKPLLAASRTSPARRKLVQMRARAGVLASDGLLRADTIPHTALLHDDMKQPETTGGDDQIVLMRTMAGTPRMAPVNPEGLRDSLKGNLGFVFEKKGTGNLRYEVLRTQAQVDRERGKPTVKAGPVLQAPLLSSFWDDIVDFATDVYNGATKIVVSIAESVEIAITKMVKGIESIVHAVVKSVEDALNAVAAFFDQLMVGIKKLIEFLRVLFDWQEILKTHKILHDTFIAIFDITVHSLRNTGQFTNAIASLAGVKAPPVPSGQDSLNATAKGVKDDSPAAAQANSVQGKSMMQRASTNPARSTQYNGAAAPSPVPADPSNPMEVLARELPALFNDILDLSAADLVARLESIVTKAASAGLVVAGKAAAAIMGQLAEVITWTVKALDAKIDIPFISELYKWITGSDLTLLDVLCLALAIPVNLAYAVVTLLQGGARPFAGDVGDLAGQLRAAAGLAPKTKSPALLAADGIGAEAPVVPGTPQAPEIAFVVFRTITLTVDMVADVTFAELVVKGQAEVGGEMQKTVNYWQGLAGIISLSLQTFASQKSFEARLRAVAGSKADEFLPPVPAIVYTLYGLQMVLRVVKMRGAVADMLGIDTSGPSRLTELKNKADYPVAVTVACVALPTLIVMIKDLMDRKKKLAAYGNDNLTTEFTLLATRDILSTTNVLFEWMYTQQGAKNLKTWAPGAFATIYDGVYIVRHVSNLAGVVLHSVAVFKYGD